MKRFAFYGRTSRTAESASQTSHDWQRERARALIEPAGGRIVAEYFDSGVKRLVPWHERPHARRLLDALTDPDRGFEAVVIGEPHRAFFGNQFGLTAPIFHQHGVPLWVPELSGPIDPCNEAHDIVMTLYASMSKAERIRIRTRVHASMEALTRTAGRFLGGRAPFGYRLTDAGPHPHPGRARLGHRIHRLDIDPPAAHTVERIFASYLNGSSITAIADQLTTEQIPRPDGSLQRWRRATVAEILRNPRYTGHAVWNRTSRRDTPIDNLDTTQGDRMVRRVNSPDAWVWSAGLAHPAIIDTATYHAAQQRLFQNSTHNRHRQQLVRCAHCGQFLALVSNTGVEAYRCPTAWAPPSDHPRAPAISRQQLTGAINEWVARSLAATPLAAGHQAAPGQKTHQDALTACERILGRYREALEAGAAPELIAEWSRPLARQRQTLQEMLRHASHPNQDEFAGIMATPTRLAAILDKAQADHLVQLYTALNLHVSYHSSHTLTITTTDEEQTS